MSWQVIIRPNAEADACAARRWYESQRASLGAELLAEISHAVRVLQEHPDRRPIYYRRFPYKLFYRIEGDRVIVFRILHAKRDHRRRLGS